MKKEEMEQRLQKEQVAYEKKKEQENRLAAIRLVSFLIGAVGVAFAVAGKNNFWWIVGIIGLTCFFGVVIVNIKWKQQLQVLESRCQIFKRYLARYDVVWQEEKQGYKRYGNPYVMEDLDIYGQESLHQYLNVTGSEQGADQLAYYLSCPEEDFETLKFRQEAVAELIEKKEFSFDLEAASYRNRYDQVKTKRNQENQENMKFSHEVFHTWFSIAFLIISWGSIAGWLFQLCSSKIPIFLFGLQMFYSYLIETKFRHKQQGMRENYFELKGYQEYFEKIGLESFQSKLLDEIKKEIGNDGLRAMKKLSFIVEWMAMSFQPIVYLLLCIGFLWNVHGYMMFERWNRKYAKQAQNCEKRIGQVEALLSLAVLGRVKQEYTFPVLEQSAKPVIHLDQMKHPFIKEEQAVANDVSLQGETMIITGSNMSGKTTFMRTIGINLCLAYSGAPVCATSAFLSNMTIFTSMRVKDDVKHGISTFYAEVLRMKEMIEFSRKNCPMIVLVDEIFKGTNSADRIVGAENVVKQLSKSHCITVVSTHDQELCEIPGLEQVRNMHFQEYFENDKIAFDYKIRPGKCKSTNAIYLLKMTGLIEE